MPVFVLGSVRSGTSTVAEILRRHGDFEGHGEGHLWTLLPRLIDGCRSHFIETGLQFQVEKGPPGAGFTLASDLSYDRIVQSVQESLRACIVNRYAREWFDKTPGPAMIRLASCRTIRERSD